MMLFNSTQQHLAVTLVDMCRDTDIDDITVSLLCKSARLTRQTFYNHFKNIDDCVVFSSYLPLFIIDRAQSPSYYDLLFEIFTYEEQRAYFYSQFAKTQRFYEAWMKQFPRMSLEVAKVAPDFVLPSHPIVLSCFSAVHWSWWKDGLQIPAAKIAELLSGLKRVSEETWPEMRD